MTSRVSHEALIARKEIVAAPAERACEDLFMTMTDTETVAHRIGGERVPHAGRYGFPTHR